VRNAYEIRQHERCNGQPQCHVSDASHRHEPLFYL
jgi:hypothetical protein